MSERSTCKWSLWLWGFACALSMLCFPTQAQAQEACDANGIVLGFFNGVQTLEEDAHGSLERMKLLYGATTPNGERITYSLFYNDTQGFADFVETFDQRLQEHGVPLVPGVDTKRGRTRKASCDGGDDAFRPRDALLSKHSW